MLQEVSDLKTILEDKYMIILDELISSIDKDNDIKTYKL